MTGAASGANDGQPENNKAFYENLPFHGLQATPNKVVTSFTNKQTNCIT